MSFRLYRRSGIGTILMAVLIFDMGCRGWIEKPIVPDTGVARLSRGLLRVTKTDGATITLKDAVIRNDSIVGVLPDAPGVRAGVARADVTKIETRGDTTPREVRIAWVGWILAGVVVVLATIWLLSLEEQRAYCCELSN